MSDWTGMGPNLPAPKLDPDCQCVCHTQPGVMHVVACCSADRRTGAAMTATRGELAARGIRVKALKLENGRASTPFGDYYVYNDSPGMWCVNFESSHMVISGIRVMASEDNAKAAAQADYEARILAALEVTQ